MKPSSDPTHPQPDVAPIGYPPQDQNMYPIPQQQVYGQQQYPQQPYFTQGYAQPGFPNQTYSYPPPAAGPAVAQQYASYGSPNPYQQNPYQNKPPQQPGYFPQAPYDEELGRFQEAASFAEASVRKAFVRKVFGILSLMMMVTVSVVVAFMYVDPIKVYLRQNTWPFWSAFAVSFGILIYLSCSPNAARKYPANMIFLFLFTICQSVLVGTATMSASPEAVLIAASATLGITVALTLFAVQTKWDFTTMGGVLMGALVTLLICSFLGFFIRVKWYYVVISGVGALLFCVFLVYDIQLIMGKGRYQLSPDDYVFGAIALYLDIINIFLYILSIVGLVKDD